MKYWYPLAVSLDYLAGKTNVELDNSIIKRVIDIQNLPDEDKKHLFYTFLTGYCET